LATVAKLCRGHGNTSPFIRLFNITGMPGGPVVHV
jgi:hypothetical protein